MYRSERQATQRQNKTSIEEAYFQRPFDTSNYNESTMEYTYDIPQQFATNPSQEKTIGVRRVKLIPDAFSLYIKVSFGDTQDQWITKECLFDFQSDNNMIEILHTITEQLTIVIKEGEQVQHYYKLFWEYDGNHLKVMPTVDDKPDPDLKAKISSSSSDFFHLFNQPSTVPNFLDTEFTMNNPLTLSNVWNRREIFAHASFSNSTNRFICSTNDFYEDIDKRFEDNTYQSTFKVHYTTDGFVRIAPLSAYILIELSFKIR